MNPTGWKLALDGKSMSHVHGGSLTRTATLGVWACDGCAKRSEPADLDNLDAWVAWRDEHKDHRPVSRQGATR